MKDIAEKVNQPDWKKFLALSEQLVRQTTIRGQAEFIRGYIQDLGEYDVDIWFSEVISKVPGSSHSSMFPPIPPTPLMQKVAQDRKISIIGKSGQAKHYSGSEPPSMIAFPLCEQDTFLGILQVYRLDNMPLDRSEVEFIEGLAAHIAVGLQISHHTIIKNWRLEQLSLVHNVSEQIANMLDLGELCNKVSAIIQKAFHYYAVNLYTIDQKSQKLVFRASSGYQGLDASSDGVHSVQMGKGLIGEAASTGSELLVNDVSREKRFLASERYPHTKSEVVLPLKVEDKVLGVLDIQSDVLYAFHDMDMLVLRSLAVSIALAVDGTLLVSDIQRRVEQLSAVSEVGKAISSILDFEQLLQEVVDLIQDRFDYPFIHLFLVQPDTEMLKFRAGAGDRAKILSKSGLQYSTHDKSGIIPWVARQGKTLIANDVSQEAHYRPSGISPSETASEMAVPLRFGDEILGVLDIQSDSVGTFDDDDRMLFEALADSIAIAIRNSKLYNAEKWRRQASDALREVAGLLPGNMAIHDLLDIILTNLENILPCEASAIWLVDPESTDSNDGVSLQLAAAHGVTIQQVTETCCDNPIAMEWLTSALQKPKPTIREQKDPFGPLGKALHYANDYSSIAAPMLVNGEPVGLLTLAHHTPRRYGEESTQLTSAFASYAAVAIQNNRLYASAQEQAWIATVLLQVAEATQSIETIDDLLQTVIRLTPMMVGVKGSAILTWDEHPECFHLAGTHGIRFQERYRLDGQKFCLESSSVLQKMVSQNVQVSIHDLQTEFPFLEELSEEDAQSTEFVLLPLLSRDKLIGGFLVAYNSDGQAGPTSSIEQERLTIIQGIAHQTAIAVENFQLLEKQQQETYVSAALLQVAQTLVSHTDIHDVFASIVQITPILVGSEICVIFLWDEYHDAYSVTTVSGVNNETEESLLNHPFHQTDARLIDKVCAEDQVITIPVPEGVALDPMSWANVDPEFQIQPETITDNLQNVLIGVPLGVKGDVYGAMFVVDHGLDKAYFSKRLELITGIAQQTSLAIQNDQLQNSLVVRERLEREFQLAREIQETFLPKSMPENKGWEIDARWRPARDVGGDFYDVFELPHRKLALVIADVSDKGISAALYMTLTRTMLRTMAQQHHSPAKILTMVNELLLRDTPHGMFVTAMLAVLDIDSATLEYANAGHLLPLIKRHSSNQIEKLEKGGMPLGILDRLNLQDKSIRLEPGDQLLLYTDGVTDAFMDGEVFGDDRLFDSIISSTPPGAKNLLNNLDQALVEFSGSGDPFDDVTVLAISRNLE